MKALAPILCLLFAQTASADNEVFVSGSLHTQINTLGADGHGSIAEMKSIGIGYNRLLRWGKRAKLGVGLRYEWATGNYASEVAHVLTLPIVMAFPIHLTATVDIQLRLGAGIALAREFDTTLAGVHVEMGLLVTKKLQAGKSLTAQLGMEVQIQNYLDADEDSYLNDAIALRGQAPSLRLGLQW